MIHFFWVAEYNNNTILPQFDLKTGKENLYSDIETNKLVKIGWHPFTAELSKMIPGSIFNPLLSKYVLNIRPNDEIFIRRRNHIQRIGKIEKRFTEYILGNQDFILVINEDGNCEIKYDIE